MSLHDPFSDTLYERSANGTISIATEKVIMRIISRMEVAVMSHTPVPSPAAIMSLDEWTMALSGMPREIVTTMAKVISKHFGLTTLSAASSPQGETHARQMARRALECVSNPDVSMPALDVETAQDVVSILFDQFNDRITAA